MVKKKNVVKFKYAAAIYLLMLSIACLLFSCPTKENSTLGVKVLVFESQKYETGKNGFGFVSGNAQSKETSIIEEMKNYISALPLEGVDVEINAFSKENPETLLESVRMVTDGNGTCSGEWQGNLAGCRSFGVNASKPNYLPGGVYLERELSYYEVVIFVVPNRVWPGSTRQK